MKKKLSLGICTLLAVAALCTFPVANALLSPGMAVIENELELIKSGMANNDITFTAQDFKNVTGANKISSVTVMTLPDSASGSLRLGDASVYENQTISRDQLEMLCFRPCTDVLASTNFDIRVNTGKNEYDLTCQIRMTEYLNAAPVIAEQNALTVRTKENVTYYGRLQAEDADQDRLNYEIVKPAKHGSAAVTDRIGGSFKYTPTAGYTGRDSFSYRVYDEFGNYSDISKVSITVEKNSSGVFYCDMVNNWAHNAAITLAENGIMTGESIGKQMIFGPDYRVSRAEFLAMAMDVCKIEPDATLTKTDFTDNEEIPSHLISYVATAKKLGYIEGVKNEEGTFFYPNQTITRAEAAVMLNKILDLPTGGSVAVFHDDASIPAWAGQSIYALAEHGLLSGTGMGAISANSQLTRAQAASVLCAVLEFEE